jgi:hypothetical protein
MFGKGVWAARDELPTPPLALVVYGDQQPLADTRELHEDVATLVTTVARLLEMAAADPHADPNDARAWVQAVRRLHTVGRGFDRVTTRAVTGDRGGRGGPTRAGARPHLLAGGARTRAGRPAGTPAPCREAGTRPREAGTRSLRGGYDLFPHTRPPRVRTRARAHRHSGRGVVPPAR